MSSDILALKHVSRILRYCWDVIKVSTALHCLSVWIVGFTSTTVKCTNAGLKMRNKKCEVLMHPSNIWESYWHASEQWCLSDSSHFRAFPTSPRSPPAMLPLQPIRPILLDPPSSLSDGSRRPLHLWSISPKRLENCRYTPQHKKGKEEPSSPQGSHRRRLQLATSVATFLPSFDKDHRYNQRHSLELFVVDFDACLV